MRANRPLSISNTEPDEHTNGECLSLFFLHFLSGTLKQKNIMDAIAWCAPSLRAVPIHGLQYSRRVASRIWLSQSDKVKSDSASAILQVTLNIHVNTLLDQLYLYFIFFHFQKEIQGFLKRVVMRKMRDFTLYVLSPLYPPHKLANPFLFIYEIVTWGLSSDTCTECPQWFH